MIYQERVRLRVRIKTRCRYLSIPSTNTQRKKEKKKEKKKKVGGELKEGGIKIEKQEGKGFLPVSRREKKR